MAGSPARSADARSRLPTTIEATRLAIELHRAGRLDEAREAYRLILARAPKHADAWHFQGLLKYQSEGGDTGIADVRRALDLAPKYSDAHANLALMLAEVRDYAGAERHLQLALKFDPKAIPPRVTLARLYRARGKAIEAERILLDALRIDPKSLDRHVGTSVHCGLGNALMAQGRIQDALDHYRRGIALTPDQTELRTLIGYALCRLGWFEQAADNYREMLRRNPDDANAHHLLASCGGEVAPSRAQDRYVRETFDAFSVSFDAKLQALGYRAPQLIADLMHACTAPGEPVAQLLDAGCGTGLLGELVRDRCQWMAGVDLSGGMLARARKRELYDELHEAELTAWLSAQSNRFDVVASADTLCYFGPLETAVASAHAALRTGAWLVFSVEHDDVQTSPHRLQHHGRYAHRRDYVESVLANAGYGQVQVREDVLRKELGEPVNGLVVAARRMR